MTDLCRRNGAIWIKAAQFFSCRPDVLPPAYIIALQALQNDATPVSFDKVAPVLERAWGSRWRDRFREFNEVPAATASIAQVHRATLLDGKVVTHGGRVLCATALGSSVREAQKRAYELAAGVSWEGCFYRRDIGYRAIAREQQENDAK